MIEEIFQANRYQKQIGVAILICDKTDSKAELVRRDKEGQFILTKETVSQEKITYMHWTLAHSISLNTHYLT
jgi:hypothetical protein